MTEIRRESMERSQLTRKTSLFSSVARKATIKASVQTTTRRKGRRNGSSKLDAEWPRHSPGDSGTNDKNVQEDVDS